MSFEHVKLVLESDLYSGITKAVLVALTHHINAKRAANNGDYEVYPGKTRLMRVSGWKETAVEKAIKQLIEDGIVQIKSLGAGEESTRYILHLGVFMVGRETAHSGSRDNRGGSSDGPGVGRETAPNKEAGSREGKRNAKAGTAEDGSTALSDFFHPTAKEQPQHLRGFAPEPPPGTSSAGPKGEIGETRHSLRSSPSSASPHDRFDDIQRVGELLYILLGYVDDPFEHGAAIMATEDYFSANPDTDPFVLGHHMVWAFAKSNYWGKTLINSPEFYDHYDLIAKQYEKFYSEREEKSRPERVWPTLKKLLAYRIKKQKEETAKVEAPSGDGRPVEIDEL